MLGLFKKKVPEQKINQPSSQDVELEKQRKLVNINKTLEEMKDKIEVNSDKVEQMKDKVKKLIHAKKKTEAKRQLQILKTLQDELAKQENMCIMIEKTKIQLEGARDMEKTIEAFKDAATFQKEAEMNREFLEDYLIEKREIDENNKEIGKLLGEIAAGDEEEIDDMYKEFEQEVLDEQMDNINNDPLKNAIKPQVQTHTTQVKQMEESSVDDLLRDAALYA